MAYGFDRLRPTLAADNDALLYAALPGAPDAKQLAETRVEPISVPRPQPFDTVTIGVVTGRPLKLDFTVDEVKTREVERDDLILGFENGGKVVLKDYMYAFGLLGDQRTTIIQPDGKHYPFTELLAPTAGAKPEAPAPGAGPEGATAEGGHLFSQFDPGGSLGPLDHLGALGPEPVSLIPPPGPPESPPMESPPPNTRPPPDIPPPIDCKPPPPEDCAPPPPACEPPPLKDCAPDPKEHGDSGKKGGESHGNLTWIVAAGCEIAGDVQGEGGRWGDGAKDGGRHARVEADAGPRGWSDGHDEGPAAQHMLGAQFEHASQALWAQHDADDGTHARGSEDTPLAGGQDHDGGWSGDNCHGAEAQHGGMHERGADGKGGPESSGAPMSSKDVFDSGNGAPAHAGEHGAGHFAAAHDFGAVGAHAESHAPQVQNHALHNVMGHG